MSKEQLLELAIKPDSSNIAITVIENLKQALPDIDLASIRDDKFGATILHWACLSKNLDLVDYILDNKLIDINTPMGKGYNLPPIASAISNLDFKIMSNLISRGAKLDYKRGDFHNDGYDNDNLVSLLKKPVINQVKKLTKNQYIISDIYRFGPQNLLSEIEDILSSEKPELITLMTQYVSILKEFETKKIDLALTPSVTPSNIIYLVLLN